jgi:asparagine synthase (glutamine-hydrolysing)
MKGILPDEVLFRKKSPYPKTHNPSYLAATRSWVKEILNDPSSPVLQILDAERIRQLADIGDGKLDLPWFGQLMSTPQLFAYIGQLDAWLREYNVAIK